MRAPSTNTTKSSSTSKKTITNMTSAQLKKWLQWRKELGLPPVPQDKINDMMNQTNIVVIDNPRTVNVMRKHTYLWGLITFYRAVK